MYVCMHITIYIVHFAVTIFIYQNMQDLVLVIVGRLGLEDAHDLLPLGLLGGLVGGRVQPVQVVLDQGVVH